MNYLKLYEDAVGTPRQLTFPRQELMLAWLQFNQGPGKGLHPDDYLALEEGWAGWHVVLANTIHLTTSDPMHDEAADVFIYPNWISRIEDVLAKFDDFHASDAVDGEYLMLDTISRILAFFFNMDLRTLDRTIEDLDRLIGFHSDGPEDMVECITEAHKVLVLIRDSK